MAYNTLSVMGTPYYLGNNINFRKKSAGVEYAQEEAAQNKKPAETEEADVKEAPNHSNGNVYQRLAESKAAQQRAIISRDEKLKDATVNIAQILKDFRNTGLAIGTPDEIMDNVDSYIALVKNELKNENPDTQAIRSNLKNASSLLDRYITDTLQKPSKVVSNWIDAIFLQQVNYSYNEEEINPNFSVKFPESKEEKTEEIEETSEPKETVPEKNVIVPEDEKLKKLFIKAKKCSYAKDYKTAMETFKQALDRAIEVEDKDTESKVLFEMGTIYDKNDYLSLALTSYNRSIKSGTDINVKSKAHYSMAKIYDDVAQFESAINHYMSSISYAGEAENLASQSASLTKIGNIYADTYKKEAFEYFTAAQELAEETDNHKIKGYVCANIANAHNKFNQPREALKFYSTAVIEYDKAEMPKKVAINYKRAADLMEDYNNPNKAKKLLQKALIKARQTDDVQLMNEIHYALQDA